MAGKGGGGPTVIPTEPSFIRDPITHYRTITGQYPGNHEAWWAYKRPLAVGSDRPPKQKEVFDPDLRNSITQSNARAPSGHYIYNAFHIDRTTASGVAGLPTETSGAARPAVCAFFAGRAVYAGVRSPKYNTRLYFSQILERDSQVGLCHQLLDPTDENTPDLLPNDGGVIKINEIEEIVKLHVRGTSLIVMATNGIWQITGSEGIGFRANDFSVSRISEVPCISATSVVNVDGNLMWWNLSGIYALQQQDGGLNFTVTPITDTTIKDFYLAIPAESRRWAKGAFNYRTKTVQWIYSDTAPETVAERYSYNRVLVLDVMTGSFSPWTSDDSDDVRMKGIFVVEGDAVTEELVDVYVGDEQVLIDLDPVFVTERTRTAVDAEFRYITHVGINEEDIGNFMYVATNPA